MVGVAGIHAIMIGKEVQVVDLSYQQRNRFTAKQVIFRLAWLSLAALFLAAHMASIPIKMADESDLGWPEWSAMERQAAWADFGVMPERVADFDNGLNILLPFAYIAFALFLFWKKPTEKMAVLIATLFMTFSAGRSLHLLAGYHPALETGGNLVDVLSSILSFVALALFPDGQFKPKWTRWSVLLIVLTQIWRLFNPDGYQVLFPVFGGSSFLLIAAGQIQRYKRHSNAIQRLQIKWVIFSLVTFLLALGIYMLLLISFPELNAANRAGLLYYLIGNLIWFGFLIAFPTTLLVAIFKSQLWDIDLVIRRTLIYSTVMLLLGLVYLGAVTILQNLFMAASGQSTPLSIVLSTLAIAAMFSPLRRRVQSFIDRRFYRQKYNAEQVLAAFAERARQETDLEALTAGLVEAVQETMRPEQVRMWLKPQEGRTE
jgi:hypothetical protein